MYEDSCAIISLLMYRENINVRGIPNFVQSLAFGSFFILRTRAVRNIVHSPFPVNFAVDIAYIFLTSTNLLTVQLLFHSNV